MIISEPKVKRAGLKALTMVRIIRPELPLAAGMCAVIGAMVALGALPPLRQALLGFLVCFLISASAMAFNDLFDLEVDRVNAPERPLPSGLLLPAEVIALGVFLALAGLAAAWALSPAALAAGLVVWAMGFAYNWKLKAAGIWGNLIVAASVGMTFLMGGMAVGLPWNRMAWLFALIVFLFDLAEEIAGDAMDAEGDRKRGSLSIAIRKGRGFAVKLSAGLFLLVLALTVLPAAWGDLGWRYLAPMLAADGIGLYFITRLLKSKTPAEGRRAMRGLYISASLGLLVFLAGSFFI